MVTGSASTVATILDGLGVGTIVDNEYQLPSTKFFVADDGNPDRTYEYGASGASVENYTIQSTNTAPRGVASNAAGDKVWVVDANKKVFVYNNSGGLLGSWIAGSLPNNSTVEGITTNGVDVWIVDSKSDTVYKYTGAASRTSGSQNAASSFKLKTFFGLSGNTNAKDIVTDGTSIWTVDDSATDKICKYGYVYKYTVSGKYQGSWAIDLGNLNPTGMTIDPTGASQSIWIVDSVTDRVYEYADGRSRTSDSFQATRTFALAAGNTNPQGIADPPIAEINTLSISLGSAPMPSSSSAPTANDGSAINPRVQSAVRNTDNFMSILGRSSPLPQIPVVLAQRTTAGSGKMVASETAGEHIDDLMGCLQSSDLLAVIGEQE